MGSQLTKESTSKYVLSDENLIRLERAILEQSNLKN